MRYFMKATFLAVAAAAWAWLGISGYAMAQYNNNTFGQSCDPYQGATCGPTNYMQANCNAIPETNCNAPWCYPYVYECLQDPFLTYDLPVLHDCTMVASGQCGSGFCNRVGNGNILTPYCCAGPGDVFSDDHGAFNSECFSGLGNRDVPGPDILQFCPNFTLRFDGGGPCIDWWSSAYVDAGTSPLATHGLMKVDPGEEDGGAVIYKPLGYFDYMEGLASGGYSPASFHFVRIGPNYLCQMPQYKPDGGWEFADLGAGHADLNECGQSTAVGPVDGIVYFPCCGGQERDGGLGTGEDLCVSDSNGVNHCECVQDGYRCDVPRHLDTYTMTGGFGAPGEAGECCSPGLATQVINYSAWGIDGGLDAGIPNGVIFQGQGFCRPSATYAGIGYCNCLPAGETCDDSGGCCSPKTCVQDAGPGSFGICQ